MDKEISTEYLDKINTLQELIQRVDPKVEIYKSTNQQLAALKNMIKTAELNAEEFVNVQKK